MVSLALRARSSVVTTCRRCAGAFRRMKHLPAQIRPAIGTNCEA